MKSDTNSDIFGTTADEQLMLLARKGNKNAFSSIIHRHQIPLLNFFRRMNVSTSDAEDLTQDTFIKLFKYRKRYKERAKFTTFLYFIGRRIYVDYVRKRSREQTGFKAFAEERINTPVENNSGEDVKASAVEALYALSEEMKTVVVLSIYQGFKYHEIADILDIPIGTVKTRMFYALNKLRETMSNDG